MSSRGWKSGGGGGSYSKQLLPFGLEYSDLNGGGVEKDQNELVLPINGPITKLEKETAKQYINFQTIISEGPFYTGSLQALKTSKEKNGPIYDDGDGINDGIKRYSDKYRKKRKIGRSIDEHPYILEFFPDELYSVMGVDKKQKRKLISLSNYKKNSLQDDALSQLQETDEAKANEILANLKNLAEGSTKRSAGGDGEDVDEEEENANDDEDEDFDEDDDDDYNAEKYFDDGDDDDMGDDDDGDDEAAF